jgi:hypothetical protein
MICKNALLGVVLISAVATGCSQDAIGQKNQQLKEVRLQKAQELSELCAKIIAKQDMMAKLQHNFDEFIKKLVLRLDEKEKARFDQIMHEFGENLKLKIEKHENLKGFLVKELTASDANGCVDFNKAKTMGFVLVVENNLLTRLVEDCEKYTQELAEIDSEIEVTHKQQTPVC